LTASSLSKQRTSVIVSLNFLLRAFIVLLQIGLIYWFAYRPMFYLPEPWLEGNWGAWLLSLPYAPLGMNFYYPHLFLKKEKLMI